jgi:carboxylate-amine ligase
MAPTYHLFERFGVELEYMIVDQEDLDVLPVADELLRAAAGRYTGDVERGVLTWSNELVLHLIELKITEPAVTLLNLASQFAQGVAEVNRILSRRGACLMPTGMHPWMNPRTQARIWPHEYGTVYRAFDRIFNCRRHGWANVQAVHLNLPFADEDEFGRLHAAIRLVLPILPALAASSPVCGAGLTGLADTRLECYRTNCQPIASVTAAVIPEPVFTIADYHRQILEPMYRDIAPLDPDRLLQQEWLNARGAIARFQRNTFEIRVLDMQECPAADLAILALVVDVLKALVGQVWSATAAQQAWPVEPLAAILNRTIRDADRAVIEEPDYLHIFGWPHRARCTAGELWHHLLETALSAEARSEFGPVLQTILTRGPLARRIVAALDGKPDRTQLASIYRRLCACLAEGRMFT